MEVAMTRTLFVLVVVLIPAMAPAQTPTDWPMHVGVLEPGDQILVRSVEGPRLRGEVVRVDGDSITLKRRGLATRVSASDVVSIERHDSVWNGGTIGFTAGFASGVLMMSTCDPSFMCEHSPQAILMCGAMAGGFGFGVGVLFDAIVHGDHTIYRRNESRVAVAPVVTRQSKGVTVGLRF
jgi:hypothetical protein